MGWGDIFFWPFKAVFDAVYLVLGVLVFIFLVFMVLDCINRKFKVEAERWIWVVLMLITTWIGAILYYIFVRALNPKGIAKK